MFVPSTDTPGKELLTWFRAAFPAKISAQPGRETGLTGNGLDCGWKWHESSVKYDLALRLWKTRQCSLLGDSEPYSETWPRWGTMRNGECWERQRWARITRETGSGFWPTPTASEDHYRLQGNSQQSKSLGAMAARSGGPLNPEWVEWLMGWPLGWTDLRPLETDKCHSAMPRLGVG
jgi:hypothetical protein